MVVKNDCGENADCKYNYQSGYYLCTCRPPFNGDGVECISEEAIDKNESKAENNFQNKKQCTDQNE